MLRQIEPVEASKFRTVMRGFATGVTVAAADSGDGPAGTTMNSFTSVSLEPPLVLFCIGSGSRTWPVVRRAGCFAVSFLCAGQETLAHRFAARGVDRFAGQEIATAATGAPVLADAAGFVDCTLVDAIELGDHRVVVGLVVAAGCLRDARPLVFADGGYGSV
ncbi:flavin reductase family protein [Actinomadura bangladeshensis]|uniref:Flavin reductase n=1 Tax=Actinomadura bangladeshensis TaxID=453573 RepID=A0A4R4PE77_9ACTN|nr:flavin reductase family protein [Actinomadura bangladeshensis]NEA23800.1 flavin reductase family protein [Actinomadura bangladeshensis]TDC19797.1 flavin reductase [Actinomadura bangladeshensis]